MKNKLLFTLLLLCFFAVPLFAQLNSKVVTDAKHKGLSYISSGSKFPFDYYLYKDNNNKFYLYSVFTDPVLYMQQRKVKKEEVKNNMKNSKKSEKTILGEYVVYVVDMGTFEDLYYVKTPEGDIYSLAEIERLNGADDLIEEL